MAYEFPTQAMVDAYGRSINSLPGQVRTIPTVPVQTPVGGGNRLSFRQRLAILIAGADAGQVIFPPQQPLQPTAQAPEFGVVGRAWDYMPGYNLRITPRQDQEIGFQTLKALADGYDVLRGLIERVKDKVVTRPWTIQPKEKHKDRDARADKLEDFFAYPDREHTWNDWARMLLEQVIVYDAPALYIRPTKGGEVYALEVMDGSMFSVKIGPDGRPPPADMGPAYQQVIKLGMPVVDYIKPVPRGTPVPKDPDGYPLPELVYKPRNPRVNSVYGFGPVEQMITTINIALRRETSLLSFYTHGSTPDTVFTTPATWTTKETADFKTWWDTVLEGNLQNRRGTMFVPDGAKPMNMKEGLLTDETDQWLIRIMCFFLGLNPMPFVKQMNRGQEQTHHEEAVQEGLGPWQHYFSDLINHLLRVKWGITDLEFHWEEDDPVDPVDQSKIDSSDVQAGIYHPDEIRSKRGDEPMPDDLREQMAMVPYRNAPNATVLPPDLQQAQSEQQVAHAKAMNDAVPPKPESGGPPSKSEKLEEIAALGKALASPPANIHVDAPAITVNPAAVTVAPAAVTVNSPPVNVTLPEMKQADVFVDVGATNIKFEQSKATKAAGDRTVKYARDEKGELVAEVTETTRSVVRKPREG